MNCNFFENKNQEKSDEKCINKKKCYDPDIISFIKGVYVAAIFLWIVAIFVLDLLEPDIFIWFFLSIPFIIWAINIINVETIGCYLEHEMFKSNFLQFGFIIAIILLRWNMPMEKHDKSKFLKLLVVGFILLMISMVDIWVDIKKQSIIKHFKTILHTSALVILAIALYLYYNSYQRQILGLK